MSYALAERNWSLRSKPVGTLEKVRLESIPVNQPAVSRSTTGSAPEWSMEFGRRASELLQLGTDWDGRQSAGPRLDALTFAYSLLSEAMAPTTVAPSVIPMSNGGVQLVWNGNQADVEVDVIQPNVASVYVFDHASGAETEWLLTTEFSQLSALLRSTFTR